MNTKTKSLSPKLEQDVLKILQSRPEGVGRAELSCRLRVTDRTLQKTIGELQSCGIKIFAERNFLILKMIFLICVAIFSLEAKADPFFHQPTPLVIPPLKTPEWDPKSFNDVNPPPENKPATYGSNKFPLENPVVVDNGSGIRCVKNCNNETGYVDILLTTDEEAFER